jgi:hypothetical protein
VLFRVEEDVAEAVGSILGADPPARPRGGWRAAVRELAAEHQRWLDDG